MKIKEFQHKPVQPDTYEASMALQQLMRIAKCGMKLHNMIDNDAEMESWVAKKIDLAGDYVKKVYNYTEADKAGLYDDSGMTEDAGNIDALKKWMIKYSKYSNLNGDKLPFGLYMQMAQTGVPTDGMAAPEASRAILDAGLDADTEQNALSGAPIDSTDVDFEKANQPITDAMKQELMDIMGVDAIGEEEITKAMKMLGLIKESVSEDAGDQEKMQGLLQWFKNKYDTYRKDFINDQIENGIRGSQLEQAVENNDELVELENIIDALKSGSMKDAIEEINRAKYEFSGIPGDGDDFMQVIEKLGIPKDTFYFTKDESLEARLEAKFREDAGEGHMSKSTLYHTVKYAIQLMDMIKKGDDLEGWVQSKLNKAADYLQGAANYEEYQRLNPYREELDPTLMQKHAVVIQKNIDEILDKETKLDDIDTKPGMMRILAKRVNEVEKEIAKETRKQTEGKMSDIDADMKTLSDEQFMQKYKKSKEQMKKDLNEDGHMDVPSAIRNCETIIEDAMQMKQKLETMQGELPSWMTQMIAVAASDLNDARDYLLNPTTESGIMYRAGVKKYGKKGMTAIQSAAGKGASHQEIGKIKDKYVKDDEQFDEGLKDWAKGLAAAGVIVGAVAGMGSINDAIDNSVPAIKAMNNALEMAQDAGNDELAKMIEQDLRDAKLRLDTGKDLNQVKFLQDKYSKFMPTEGLAYESKLAIQLNQRLK